MTSTASRALVVVLLAVHGSSMAQSLACDDWPRQVVSADATQIRGIYRNDAYGFSFVVPDAHTAIAEDNPFYQHGVVIPLDSKGARRLSVFAEPNSQLAKSSSELIGSYVSEAPRGRAAQNGQVRPVKFGAIDGDEVVTVYRCSGPQPRLYDITDLAIEENTDRVFVIDLLTDDRHRVGDEALLKRIRASWLRISAPLSEAR